METTIRDVFAAYLTQLVGDESDAGFARRTGVPQSDLTNALNGRRNVTVGQLERVGAALQIAPSRMFSEMALIARDLERAQTTPGGVVVRPTRARPRGRGPQ